MHTISIIAAVMAAIGGYIAFSIGHMADAILGFTAAIFWLMFLAWGESR